MASIGIVLGFWPAKAALAQRGGEGATISGTVTADQGVVRGFRVKAKDTVHRMTYTVFTNKGRYHIFNLPPSSYEVTALEPGFDSPVHRVELKSGETRTLDIAVKARPAAPTNVELVDFDALYPPGPARDVLLKSCFGCHGPSGWHRRGAKTEAEWRTAVNRMFDPGAWADYIGAPPKTHDTVSVEQQESIVKYFAANFGPGSKPRDLRTDSLVIDEDALAETLYVQYELPPVQGPQFATGQRARATHDVFPSSETPGIVWIASIGSGSIVRAEGRNLDFASRYKEWLITTPDNINVRPHGIVEFKGRVYWTELNGNHIGELNQQTGEIKRYPALTRGGVHTLRADSKGNIWFSTIHASKIGRLDAATRKVTEWEPIRDGNYYGVVVDKKNRVWVTGLSSPAVVMFDPGTEKWTSYRTAAGTRRLGIDSKGKIWFCEYFGNAIGMIDPDTGEVTEYKLPLKYGNPYEVWPDSEDNLWVENAVYNSMVKFDQKTRKFTYVPFPDLNSHTPKVEVDSEGAIWFGSGGQLTSLRPRGNRGPARAPRSGM